MIAEPCKEFFKKNLGEVFGCAKQGVSDVHYRVKYAGLSAMAMMYNECAPLAQFKNHEEVMPVLIKLMLQEPLIKMQTQATSAALNFVNGLLKSEEDEEEEETAIDPQAIMAPHS